MCIINNKIHYNYDNYILVVVVVVVKHLFKHDRITA